MILSKIRISFGFKYNSSIIPNGEYCYTPNYKKNKNSNPFTYYVIPCPYYKTLGENLNGCKYLSIITDDYIFDDQCKICNKNLERNS
jgi:hypothetical protein